MDSLKSSTTKFFLFNPTKGKIILSLFDSLALILISLIIPSMEYKSVLLSRGLSEQIFSLVGSLFFSFVVYYPLACGLVFIFKVVAGKEKVQALNLIIALLFIVIFNPITFSMAITGITKTSQNNSLPVTSVIDPKTKEKLCGLQIMEVNAPSAKNAGLVVGEVIKTVDNNQVADMTALTHTLANKRPNDNVIVVTNANTYNVTLTANTQDPRQALLGIKVKILECGK